MQQLALGTAQFGLDYGITNQRGALGPDEAQRVLAAAWEGGMRMLDTAHAYGRSEAVLGAAMAHPWRIVTKTLPLRRDRVEAEHVEAVARGFEESLQRLGVESVDTLLVHHAADLLVPGGERLWGWLASIKHGGKATRIGASVYSGAEAVELRERYPLDVVQLPASLADQRSVTDGSARELAEAGVQVHVRSLFLQGLLLAGPAFVAERFPEQRAWAQSLHAAWAARGVSPLEACLGFFKSRPEFHVAVLGVSSVGELQELLAAWARAPALDGAGWGVDNTAFTDPRFWPPRA